CGRDDGGTVEDEVATDVECDGAARPGAGSVLRVQCAAGVDDHVAADGEGHVAGAVAAAVIVAIDHAVDDQVPVADGEDAVDEAVVVQRGAVERRKRLCAGDGNVVRVRANSHECN